MTLRARSAQLMALASLGVLFVLAPGPTAVVGTMFVLLVVRRRAFERVSAVPGLGAALLGVLVATIAGLIGSGASSLWSVSFPLAAVTTVAFGSAAIPVRLGVQGQRSIAWGLVVGIGALAIVTVAQLSGAMGIGASSDVTRASGWTGVPNLWATFVVVPLLYLSGRSLTATQSIVAQPFAWIVVLGSGSRTVALALGLGLVVAYWRIAPRVLLVLAAIGAMLVAGLVLTHDSWAQRFVPGVAFPMRRSTNLFISSEDLSFGAWGEVGVKVRSDTWTQLIALPGQTWSLTKTRAQWWSRLQQTVRLQPDTDYTFVGEFKPTDAAQWFGIHGVGTRGGDYAMLRTYRGPRRTLVTRSQGELTDVRVRSVPLSAGWVRLSVHFHYAGGLALPFAIGPTPDQRPDTVGGELRVRRLQFVPFDFDGRYAPTYSRSAGSRASLGTPEGRWSAFTTAWFGFLRRPLVGWGAARFAEDYARRNPGASLRNHAHDLVLQLLYEIGLVGTVGLALCIFGVLVSAKPFCELVPVLVGLVVANVFDYTFFFQTEAIALGAVVGLMRLRSEFEGGST